MWHGLPAGENTAEIAGATAFDTTSIAGADPAR